MINPNHFHPRPLLLHSLDSLFLSQFQLLYLQHFLGYFFNKKRVELKIMGKDLDNFPFDWMLWFLNFTNSIFYFQNF